MVRRATRGPVNKAVELGLSCGVRREAGAELALAMAVGKPPLLAEAVFELHILGDDKVLGMQFGWDGTKVIYVSSVDLSRCGYFYDPIAMLLETGLELTPEMLDD